jgi:hypothetical protein
MYQLWEIRKDELLFVFELPLKGFLKVINIPNGTVRELKINSFMQEFMQENFVKAVFLEGHTYIFDHKRSSFEGSELNVSKYYIIDNQEETVSFSGT